MRVLLVLLASLTLSGAGIAELTVRSDTECRILIDGQPKGSLRPGAGLALALSPGTHRVEAIGTDGNAHWRDAIEVTESARMELTISLKQGFWKDPATGLIWAAADNGSGVSWIQARRYCESLELGGRHDWRLPAIDELQTLVGAKANAAGYRVQGPLKLTGWAWSSTPGIEIGESWALDFGDGGRASVVSGDSGLNRALCTRSGGAP